MAIIQKKDIYFTPKKTVEKYSDFATDFVSDAGDVFKLKNDDSVIQSIRNIVLTNRGERMMNPEFGCDIRSLLFENFSPGVEQVIKNTVIEAIDAYEPRAKIIDVRIVALPDNNSVSLSLIFKTINNNNPRFIDLILTRVR